MNKLEQAARQALEALEMYNEHGAILRPLVTTQALREALAESKKPEECANGCPLLQVCNYCQRAEQAECKECGAKQAQIDRLMLEYCPDEMTPEQMQEWGNNQRPVEQAEHEPEEQLSELGYAARLARELCKKHYPDCSENWKPLDSLYGVLTQIDNMVSGLIRNTQSVQEPMAIGTEWKPCMKLPVVVHVREQREGESHVSTREGITPVKPDDLIMRGVAGEEYPIGRELFNRTYTFDTAAHVRTKDLTDDEIDEIFAEHGTIPNTKAVRSVIAADREKNK